jgi:hypothetical protein
MKIKITNQQILSLNDAIAALDGRHETQIVDGKPVQVFRGCKLTHQGRWALARNLGRLQAALADFNRAKSALVTEHSNGMGAISPAHPGFNAFAGDFEQLMRQEAELDLDKLTPADLRLEENEGAGAGLPIAVLNALSPLLGEAANAPCGG